MRIELGMHVRASDGPLIGAIDKFVLDPEERRVRKVTIRWGRLRRHDVEVGVELLHANPEGELWLDVPASQIDTLPHFEASNYMPPPPDFEPPVGIPVSSVYLPVGYMYGPMPTVWARQDDRHGELRVILSQQDIDNAVVGKGSEVRSADGHKVGELREMSIDEQTGQVTGFTLWHDGRRMEVGLPAELIERLDDGVVYLDISADRLEALAEVDSGSEVWTADRVCIGTVVQRTERHLDVVSADGAHHLHVPIPAVDRVSRNRLLLHADSAQARLWTAGAAS